MRRLYFSGATDFSNNCQFKGGNAIFPEAFWLANHLRSSAIQPFLQVDLLVQPQWGQEHLWFPERHVPEESEKILRLNRVIVPHIRVQTQVGDQHLYDQFAEGGLEVTLPTWTRHEDTPGRWSDVFPLSG